MKQVGLSAAIAALTLAVPTSGVAEDAERSFDCNAPNDHVAQTSQPVTLPAVISGVLELKDISRGSYFPQGGVVIASVDGKDAIELMFVRTRNSSRDLSPLAYGSAGSSLPISMEKVSRFEPIHFSVSVSPSGRAVMSAGKKPVVLKAKPIESAKVVLFCSASHFTFSELNFPISK